MTLALNRQVENQFAAQSHFTSMENTKAAPHTKYFHLIIQFIFALTVYSASYLYGPQAFVFFAGGLTLAQVAIASMHLQAYLFYRALASSGAVEGAVKLSTHFVICSQGIRLLCLAFLLAFAGIVTVHLAPFGAVFFLMYTALRAFRKASQY